MAAIRYYLLELDMANYCLMPAAKNIKLITIIAIVNIRSFTINLIIFYIFILVLISAIN